MTFPDRSKEIFTALSDTEENAAVMLFVALLRSSPLLLHWLRIVSLHPAIFERLADVVERRLELPEHAHTGRQLLAWLARADGPCKPDGEWKSEPESSRFHEQEQQAHEQETAFLRQKTAPVALPSYGGLSARKMLGLVRYYQSGHLHPSAFLLAHAWRETRSASASAHASKGPACPASDSACGLAQSPLPLLHATLLYVQAALGQDRPWLLHHLSISAHFLHTHAPGTVGQAHFGHSGWWKLHLLHYMIRHPKPAYRLGEFASRLQAQRLDINPRMLRRFCIQHGIARDTSPGRPRRKRMEHGS